MSGLTAWPPNAAWRAAIPSASRRCSKHTHRPPNWAASHNARTGLSTAPDVDRRCAERLGNLETDPDAATRESQDYWLRGSEMRRAKSVQEFARLFAGGR